MPRADDPPPYLVETQATPSTETPLGVKGCGEVGTIGAPAAVINAVVDALAGFGVKHIDMPVSPARVRAAIASTKS